MIGVKANKCLVFTLLRFIIEGGCAVIRNYDTAPECITAPIDVVGYPLVEFTGVDFLHTIVVGGHHHVEAAYLTVGDFPGYPGVGDAVFDSRRKPGYPVGIFDQPVAVEVRPRRVCVVGMGGALDMLGDRVQRRVRLDDVEHCVAHKRASFCCGAIGVYGFQLSRSGVSKGMSPFGILGIFLAYRNDMRLEKFPNMLRNFPHGCNFRARQHGWNCSPNEGRRAADHCNGYSGTPRKKLDFIISNTVITPLHSCTVGSVQKCKECKGVNLDFGVRTVTVTGKENAPFVV